MRKVAKHHRLPMPQYEHTQQQQMSSQGGFHPGVAIYVDSVGGFNWRNVPELPQGYTINDVVNENPAAATNALLKLVAFNNGNAGELLAKSGKKFRVVTVAESKEQYRGTVEAIKKEIAGAPYEPHIAFERLSVPDGVTAW